MSFTLAGGCMFELWTVLAIIFIGLDEKTFWDLETLETLENCTNRQTEQETCSQRIKQVINKPKVYPDYLNNFIWRSNWSERMRNVANNPSLYKKTVHNYSKYSQWVCKLRWIFTTYCTVWITILPFTLISFLFLFQIIMTDLGFVSPDLSDVFLAMLPHSQNSAVTLLGTKLLLPKGMVAKIMKKKKSM